jgi:hypothetical protein
MKNEYNVLGLTINKQQLGTFSHWFFLCLSILLWNISVFFSNDSYAAFGLFNGLNFSYYIGLIVVILNLSLSIYKHKNKFYVILNAIILFFYLFGISFFITLDPRIFSGFQYLGHWEYLDRIGELNPQSLWYHSWPGMFFIMGLLMSPLKGTAKYILTFAVYPLVYRILFSLFLFVLIKEIFKLKLNDEKKEKSNRFGLIIALILINMYDWISQDYFTPQSIGFLLFVGGFIFILDYYSKLKTNETMDKKFLLETLLFVGSILLFSVALAFTHMVSSVFLFTTFLIFAVIAYIKKIRETKSMSRRKIIISLVGLAGLFVAFIAVIASTNWFRNNFRVLLNKLKSFEPKVFQILFENITSSSPARLVIISVRLLLSAAFIALTIYYLYKVIIKKRKLVDPIFSLLLAIGSLFLIYVFIYYSDEVFQRSYLFFIPVVIFALTAITDRLRFKQFLIIMLVVSPLFLLSKYGNEEVDIVTESEIRLIEFINENYKTGTVIISPRQLLMGYNQENYESLSLFTLDFTGSTFGYLTNMSRTVPDDHLVVLTSEYYFRVVVFRNLDDPYTIMDELLNSSYYSLIYNEDNNYVFKHIISTY